MLVSLAGAMSFPPTTFAAAADDGGDSSTVHRITIEKFKYGPSILKVKTGDTIEWVNKDFAPHTATALDDVFKTEKLKRGDVGMIVAGAPQTIDYTCQFHSNMKGQIVIESGD